MTRSSTLRAPRASLDVIVAPKPFTPSVEASTVAFGATVAQLLTRACRSGVLSVHDLSRTEVYIDGLRLVDRLAAKDMVPAAGSTVNIVVLPQGGGGGGHKNPLQMVLMIAVMVAAFAIAGPAGPLAAGLAGAGITGLAATAIEVSAMAAINLAGTAAASAIFGSSSSSSATSPIYSLDNQSNQARQGKAMPLCLGGRRVAFDVAATAYSTIIDTDTWITVIYGIHYGPCAVADLKIGETLASVYPAAELTVEYHLTPGSRESSLYPSRIDQASLQNELDPLHADWSTETSGIEATRLEIDLYWPQLIYTSSGGEQKNQDSVVYIQYSPYGANQWQPAPGLPAGHDADGNAYPAGSYWIQEKTQNPTRRTIGWNVTSGQYDVRVGRRIRRGGDTTRSVDDVTWTALRTINTAQPAIADEFLSIVIIKAKASQDFNGTLGVVTGVVTPIVPTFDTTAQAWQGDPTAYDAVNWQPTSNAAALARYLLTGYPAAKPLLAAQIDSSFGQHYATIEQMNWHGGMLQAEDASQEDVLVKLGKLGRCYFYWNGETVCCAPDYIKPAPRQVFSGRNAKDYQYKRVFPDPIHAVYVTFDNADEDWKADGLYVYNDGYNASNAVLREEMALDFACDMNRAHREGRVYLAKRKLLTETHQWTAGVDSIASTFGDRVAVRHISTLFGIGEARVKFRRFQGGLVAGLRLDTSVTFEAGQTYTIDVRRYDQVTRGLPLTTAPGTTRDLVFAVPTSIDDAPLAGDLVVIGQTGVVTEDVEIVDISPKPDGSADIVAQSYRAADIVAAETAAIPALQSALTARVAAPVPVIVGALGSVNGVVVSFDVAPQRQATIQGFTARWRRSPDEDATATWNTLPLRGATDRTVQTPAFPEAQVVAGGSAEPFQVDVEIRTILSTGETSQPAQALNIVVQKGVLAPTNFMALAVIRSSQDGSSYPAIQVDCDPQDAGSTQDLVVELQPAGSQPPAWRASASGPFHADLPEGDLTDVVGGQAYDVRARWRTADNWYSDYVTQADVPVPSGAAVASNTVNVGDRESAALLASVDQATSDIETSAEADIGQMLAQVQSGTALDAARYALGLIGGLNDGQDRLGDRTGHLPGRARRKHDGAPGDDRGRHQRRADQHHGPAAERRRQHRGDRRGAGGPSPGGQRALHVRHQPDGHRGRGERCGHHRADRAGERRQRHSRFGHRPVEHRGCEHVRHPDGSLDPRQRGQCPGRRTHQPERQRGRQHLGDPVGERGARLGRHGALRSDHQPQLDRRHPVGDGRHELHDFGGRPGRHGLGGHHAAGRTRAEPRREPRLRRRGERLDPAERRGRRLGRRSRQLLQLLGRRRRTRLQLHHLGLQRPRGGEHADRLRPAGDDLLGRDRRADDVRAGRRPVLRRRRQPARLRRPVGQPGAGLDPRAVGCEPRRPALRAERRSKLLRPARSPVDARRPARRSGAYRLQPHQA